VMTHPVPLRDQGTWAPQLIAPAGLMARKPPNVSWAAAAAFPVPALTALQVLVDALGLVRALTGGRGATAAANAAPAGSAAALRAVADDGRLATITGDPPSPERGVTITNVYVRPDGTQLGQLATQFGAGQLHVPVAAHYHLADAAQALAQATGAHAGGAITLTP